MSTFKEKVEDIVGVTVSDTTALSDYLTASAREVSDILPDEVLMYNSTLLESASTVEISNTKVFAVSRNGRYLKIAKKKPAWALINFPK